MNEVGLYGFESGEHIHHVSSLNTIHEFLARWASRPSRKTDRNLVGGHSRTLAQPTLLAS
jgi:hypothetical protein